jgi:cell division protein FtsZ
VHYKGEDNLRQLDTPAYERRTSPLRSRRNPSASSDDEDGDDGSDESSSSANIRRLRADELKRREDREDREERIRKDDTDTPAFLRKMMD